MTYEPRLARLAAMIADPARSRMLAYLLAGHYASAGELAAAASVSASTASGHLAKLRGGGLLASERRGRHRYFKLADADVAHALEALAVIAERGSHERQWNAPGRHQLRYARRCYGHLAGELGVALCDSLVANRRIEASQDGYLVTAQGEQWLLSIGLEPPRPQVGHRLAYPCLDWSERRDHLAGRLATTLLDHFIAKRWLVPNTADRAVVGADGRNRALRVTPSGEATLLPQLLG